MWFLRSIDTLPNFPHCLHCTWGWERISILSWSSSPWSSKTTVLMPVSGSRVKMPSVAMSLAVCGFGGMILFLHRYSDRSHWRNVGRSWRNWRRSSSSSMLARASFNQSSWISLINWPQWIIGYSFAVFYVHPFLCSFSFLWKMVGSVCQYMRSGMSFNLWFFFHRIF